MEFKGIKARDIMITELMTISPTEKVAAADLIMVRNSIGALPVIDNERMVGIITQDDIMLSRFSISVGGLQVGDLMTRNPNTITPDTPLDKIIEVMVNKQVERLPVVTGEKLVGLVTYVQILKKIYQLV
jgi:tRNA nucleotidyltransferase (CCA-adding enzyme)